MLKNNPQPDLDYSSTFYITHLMNLITESVSGVIPILKIYEYCHYWGIENHTEFGEIITTANEYVQAGIRKRQESKTNGN